MRRSRPERPKSLDRARFRGSAGVSAGPGEESFDADFLAAAADGEAPAPPHDDPGPRRATDDAVECERRAVAFLALREHSRAELERKLGARGFPPHLVAETLDRLEQNGLLSGQRFISGFIASRAERGSGPAKIRAELVRRGVHPDEAAAAVRAADEDWVALARRARTKRFGAFPPGDYGERARQARFLRGRGFEPEQIDAALEVGADSD